MENPENENEEQRRRITETIHFESSHLYDRIKGKCFVFERM